MKKIFFLFIVSILICSCSAQHIQPIIQYSRYSHEIRSSTANYYYFAGYYIDSKKEGIINLETLNKGIDEIIKDVDYSGFIILNIENKIYQELKTNPQNHKNYQNNIDMFVEMVKMVKRLRPKAKVGIYNIPFVFHYKEQRQRNDFEKLSPLLKAVDFFAPSIYLHYTNEQRQSSFFNNYINSNLDLNFEHAEKLNKKVYPFIWYKIHPSNIPHGGNVISYKQYVQYLGIIKRYRYKGNQVEKIIYWEPAKQSVNIEEKLKETIKLLR